MPLILMTLNRSLSFPFQCSSGDAAYVSRHVLLRCGIPQDRPALTVNRLCGSGFQAVVNGAQEILVGDSNVVLTGGTESMSQAPFLVRNVRFGTKLGGNYNVSCSGGMHIRCVFTDNS